MSLFEMGALSGSREPSPDGLGPSGFDPARSGDAMASRLWFDDCDQIGWPNGRPTWREVVAASDAGDEEWREVAYRFRSYAAAALHVASHLADPARIADLELALGLALDTLIRFEPGDSRAVSDEFVAMAAILSEVGGNREECREIIRKAIATEARRAETENTGSVHEGAGRNGIAQEVGQ